MTQVNGVPNSNNAGWNRQLANQLDEMDGKKDGKISGSVFDNSSKSCDISLINAANALLKQNANSTPTQETSQKIKDAIDQIKNGSNTIPTSPETQAALKNLDLEKITKELGESMGIPKHSNEI